MSEDYELIQVLRSCNYDPAKYVDSGILLIEHFTKLNWGIQCQKYWFPGGNYDDWVIKRANSIIDLD